MKTKIAEKHTVKGEGSTHLTGMVMFQNAISAKVNFTGLVTVQMHMKAKISILREAVKQ